MKTSVVIITYNRPKVIDLCLNSIDKQTVPPEEIVVIDSSDNDDTKRALAHRRVTYRHTGKRLYQPQARNLSLCMADGDVILFVDDDVICAQTWLENIIEGYSISDAAGVSGPVIKCDEAYRPIEKIKTSNRNQNFFTFYGDIHVNPAWVPSKPVKTKLMMGSNMSFLKARLKEVGGFDEHYGEGGAYREETDLQIALNKKQYYFMYMPGAVVYHLQYSIGGIRSRYQSDYYYCCGRYHRYLADKYFPKWSTRASWIFWSFDPPCLWLSLCLAILRTPRALGWVKGLWE